MRTYKFTELRRSSKQKALEDHWDWNVADYDWWDSTYDDAERCGLKITEFELDYRTIDGKLNMSAWESIKAILEDHGPSCDTYQLAERYKELFRINRFNRAVLGEEDWEEEDEDLVEDYKKALLRCYIDMLKEDYDYQTSEESIKESWQCNGTEFYWTGEMA